MANVFTKKHGKPRTTTLSDFSSFRLFGDHIPNPRRPRVLSPTRRVNPHPTGLVSQDPYNKDMLRFDIWNPNFIKIGSRMPEMIGHLERANFSSGKVLPPMGHSGKPPEVKYSLGSIARRSYCEQDFPSDFKHLVNTTRFGCSPYKPAQGIVPNTLPPIYRPSQEKQCKPPADHATIRLDGY